MQALRVKIILFIFLILSTTARAETCPVLMGGYCLETLWQETNNTIQISNTEKTTILKEIITSIETSANLGQGDAAPTSYYGYYEKLWEGFLQKELVSKEEKQKAFEEAANAGGTKIGGINLVVLGARTLQKLVDLQVINLEQAQQILNKAKLSPHPSLD